MNKNVSRGAVISTQLQKQNEVQGVHKLLANYQTGGYKFRPTISWNGRIGSCRPMSLSFINTITKSTQA